MLGDEIDISTFGVEPLGGSLGVAFWIVAWFQVSLGSSYLVFGRAGLSAALFQYKATFCLRVQTVFGWGHGR